MTTDRTPLNAARDGIRRLLLGQAKSEDGIAAAACRDCQAPGSWCSCEQLARAALSGLSDAWYGISESR